MEIPYGSPHFPKPIYNFSWISSGALKIGFSCIVSSASIYLLMVMMLKTIATLFATRSAGTAWKIVPFLVVNRSLVQLSIGYCHHTAQGISRVTDEFGYVCTRNNLLRNGCCDQTKMTPSRFTCSTCSSLHCCSVYEYCVSCCLNPVNVCVLIWCRKCLL